MAGKKVGSDGQVRKTTAEWSADVNTYPEGMRLMDTDTGVVRTSKGTTYALAWVPATGTGGGASEQYVDDAVAAEATLRDGADTYLLGLINAEASARDAADEGLLEEDPGQGVGLIESGAGVTPFILKNAKGGDGTEVVSNTGSFQVNIVPNAASTILDGATDPFARTSVIDALSTVAEQRTGSAIAFDMPAEYNTAASPSNGSVTANYTGAIAGTQVLCWFNHAAEPSWPAGWTVTGVWNNSALNALVLTYRTGTTVSGYIVSDAAGAATNPSRVYCLTADFAVTSATPLKVAGIEGIPVLAGKLYAIEWYAKGTCSGTSGGYFGLWANTGTDHDLFMAGRTDFAADAGVYFSIGANSGYNSAATSYPWFAATLASNFGRCAGTILGGAADATFEMRARSVNAAQTFTVTKRGTWFRITPLD